MNPDKLTDQEIEAIRRAIIEHWKNEFVEMDKELNGIGVYFITGFVSEAIKIYNQNKEV